jgi:zeaxanthin glucosyltransferase
LRSVANFEHQKPFDDCQGWLATEAGASLPNIVQSNQIDALVIDCVSFYAELPAIKLGIPYIHVSAGMHFDYTGHTPLSLHNWPHETTTAALARNQDGVASFAQTLNEVNGGIRAYANAAGLKIDWDNPGSTLSSWASISQVPKAFDFESSHWPPQFHRTGPFHDGKGREPVDFPWDRLTGEPLIYASMGTIVNGRPEVFRTIIAALAKNKDLQLARACLSLHHPCRIKHRTGMSSAGSSASGHPGDR